MASYRYTYERLSAQDNSFLLLERDNIYMHVAATAIYKAGPMRTAAGGVDIEAFRKATEAVLHLIPRYRQKLKWIPYANHPVWIDDEHFNLDYHIRHTSLPRPGTDDQLRRLAGRIMSQRLDRAKPLWEMWVVEGLSEDRFAVVSKVHHCMIDGSAGADLATILMSLTPEVEINEPLPFIPRPVPSSIELLFDHLTRRFSLPYVAYRTFKEFSENSDGVMAETMKRFRAVGELVGYAVRSASDTPLNGSLGPHRRFDWLEMPLEGVKQVRRAYGCTVNDLVLAIVTGAVQKYLKERAIRVDDVDFRVSAPVSLRREEERGELGNKVSSWIVPLPLAEPDAARRLSAITEITSQLKKSKQAMAVELLMAAAEWTPAQLMSLGSRATSGPINMIVTNVPGPQLPLYMLGAELCEMYPQVPLLENTGLGVALFSYNGRLCWGFNADPELVPDLGRFTELIRTSFEELRRAAPQVEDPSQSERGHANGIANPAGSRPPNLTPGSKPV